MSHFAAAARVVDDVLDRARVRGFVRHGAAVQGGNASARARLAREMARRVPEIIDVVIPLPWRRPWRARGIATNSPRRGDACRIVIDDHSPEPELPPWLAGLAAARRITLITHAVNRGFVAAVNAGMALHPDRDVVLLNSDTEVAAGWLDRLVACARRDAAVGTATPFSTNATICSYPRNHGPNAMPPGETTASLDRAFAAANAGRSADIPTAVGFCMYITRHCLQRIGPFDYERYGEGYGE